MPSGPTNSMVKQARYGVNVSLLCGLTLFFAWYSISPNPFGLFNYKVQALAASKPIIIKKAPPRKPIIAGNPVRIVIPSLKIDLPIDPGQYDPVNDLWTISGYRAQFATTSAPANDHSGSTFIYGHYNPRVFAYLHLIKAGAEAQIYTDNNRIFKYTFVSSIKTEPADTSILDYQGPPILTVQTCTGKWMESRELFTFKFDKVLQ